jgi:3-hydroxyanthranilate 3,4-dioxygenase
MELNAGDMYLHPAKFPHSPVRSEGIGLVIERKRAAQGYVDGLWFCDNCNHKLHDVFELNIEKISCLILSISTIQSTYALVIPVAL